MCFHALIRNLNPHKAIGPDAIPAHLLCGLSVEVAPALTFVFQMSLETGQIPDDWRMAYFVPVYKRCDKCSAENNRPVSITSICSKVMEHILFSNIIQHICLVVRMLILDTEVDGSNPSISMYSP